MYRCNYCNVTAFVCLSEPSWLTLQGDVVGHWEPPGSMFLWTHVGTFLCVVQLMYLSIIIYISVAVYFCIC